MARIIHILILVLELLGFRLSFPRRKIRVLTYYTQLSNLVTFASSIAFLVNPAAGPTVFLRYLSTCMLAMTFLVTFFILCPFGGGYANLMIRSNGLYHHTLCPALGIGCYLFLEQHSAAWGWPVLLTFAYGMLMLLLNGLGKVDGPYPFFRVRNQSVRATILWMSGLVLMIAAISILIARA